MMFSGAAAYLRGRAAGCDVVDTSRGSTEGALARPHEACVSPFPPGDDNPDALTERAIKALRRARRLAHERHDRHVSAEHLLLALAQMKLNFARAVLERLG